MVAFPNIGKKDKVEIESLMTLEFQTLEMEVHHLNNKSIYQDLQHKV